MTKYRDHAPGRLRTRRAFRLFVRSPRWNSLPFVTREPCDLALFQYRCVFAAPAPYHSAMGDTACAPITLGMSRFMHGPLHGSTIGIGHRAELSDPSGIVDALDAPAMFDRSADSCKADVSCPDTSPINASFH